MKIMIIAIGVTMSFWIATPLLIVLVDSYKISQALARTGVGR